MLTALCDPVDALPFTLSTPLQILPPSLSLQPPSVGVNCQWGGCIASGRPGARVGWVTRATVEPGLLHG